MPRRRGFPSIRPRLRSRPRRTRNLTLPFRRGGFASLCEALDYAAQGETGLNFFDAPRKALVSCLPYRDLQVEARRPSPAA